LSYEYRVFAAGSEPSAHVAAKLPARLMVFGDV
jgi:hypothetical protein